MAVIEVNEKLIDSCSKRRPENSIEWFLKNICLLFKFRLIKRFSWAQNVKLVINPKISVCKRFLNDTIYIYIASDVYLDDIGSSQFWLLFAPALLHNCSVHSPNISPALIIEFL